jgi:hypothetical protein
MPLNAAPEPEPAESAAVCPPPSFRQLPPRETGGIENRQGNDLQDHIAARHCIEMLQRSDVVEIWCETHDDIVIVWRTDEAEIPEYVQVKGSEFDQLWTVARLCARDNARAGTSLLEKSFANDRAIEPPLFRLLTHRQVSAELAHLESERGLQGRSVSTTECGALCALLKEKLGPIQSPNGRGLDYWVGRVRWEVVPDAVTIQKLNIYAILEVYDGLGLLPAPDSAAEVYTRLLRKVQKAALAPANERHKKIIAREELRQWLLSAANQTSPPRAAGARVKDKMAKAGLDSAAIEMALENRVFYRQEVLRPQYLSLKDRTLAEAEVTAVLQENRTLLDAGKLTDNGVQFHARCLSALVKVRSTFQERSAPPLAFLQGCMYNLADRCLHRFLRAEP